MIARTQFAITSEDTRYFLNGAQLVLKAAQHDARRDRRPPAGARDGAARGRRDDGRAEGDPPEEDADGALAAVVDEGDEVISYEQGENHLFFHVGERLLISRKIDGQFPAYERVIPKGNDKRVEFERDRLTSAIKRVALLSNERSRAVKLADREGQGRRDVEQSRVRGGARAAQRRVQPARRCRSASTRSTSLDFLNVVETDAVALELKDEVSQAVMRPVERGRLRLHLRDHADAHLTLRPAARSGPSPPCRGSIRRRRRLMLWTH